jgi:hypothetical protein
MLRRTITTGIVAASLSSAGWCAPRNSWSHIYYAGGTLSVKSTPYDWNTVLTVARDAIVVSISGPSVFSSSKTLRIKPSQVVSISSGAAALHLVAEVPGAQVPSKPPSLFGIMTASMDYPYLGVVYETADGKREALLLETPFPGPMLSALKDVTGKPIEQSP